MFASNQIQKDGVGEARCAHHTRLCFSMPDSTVRVAGTYLIVSEANTGSKGAVSFHVEHVLFEDQVKHLKKSNLWCVSDSRR